MGMRITCLVVLGASFFCHDSLADEEKPPEDHFEALTDVAFIGDEGWAVGRNSIIIHTSDGGATWETQRRSDDKEERVLRAVSFLDEEHGVAVGTGGLVLRTDDGGKLWRPSARFFVLEQVPDAEPEIPEQEASQAVSEKNTEPEMGKKFLSPYATSGISFDAVMYVNRAAIWLNGGRGLALSRDGGRSWRLVYPPSGVHINGMHFFDENRGWIVGQAGQIYWTEDGGDEWRSKPLEETWLLNDVFFLDEMEGWVCGEGGFLAHTTDGGETWKGMHDTPKDALFSVRMISAEQGFLETPQRLYYTGDGLTWSPVEVPLLDDHVAGVGFVGKNKGKEEIFPTAVGTIEGSTVYVAGNYGLVMRSEDGGETWSPLRSMRHDFNRRALDNSLTTKAVARMYVGMGYAHPVGKISERFTPGGKLEVLIFAARGRLRIGGGIQLSIFDCKEKVIAPAGEVEADPTPLNTGGMVLSFPLGARLLLFEKNKWLMKLGAMVAFRHHSLMLQGEYVDEAEESDYNRVRIGVGLSQCLEVTRVFPIFNKNKPDKVEWFGVTLRVGLEESWTWDVDDPQKDLGRKDDTDFGTELWPFATIGMDLLF